MEEFIHVVTSAAKVRRTEGNGDALLQSTTMNSQSNLQDIARKGCQKKNGQSFHSDNANARDLSLDRDTSMGNDKVATYPVDTLPRADQKEPVPVDRKQGLKDTKAAGEALRQALKERQDKERAKARV